MGSALNLSLLSGLLKGGLTANKSNQDYNLQDRRLRLTEDYYRQREAARKAKREREVYESLQADSERQAGESLKETLLRRSVLPTEPDPSLSLGAEQINVPGWMNALNAPESGVMSLENLAYGGVPWVSANTDIKNTADNLKRINWLEWKESESGLTDAEIRELDVRVLKTGQLAAEKFDYTKGRDTTRQRFAEGKFKYGQEQDELAQAAAKERAAQRIKDVLINQKLAAEKFDYTKGRDTTRQRFAEDKFKYGQEQDIISNQLASDRFSGQQEDRILNRAFRKKKFLYGQERDVTKDRFVREKFDYKKSQDKVKAKSGGRVNEFEYNLEQLKPLIAKEKSGTLNSFEKEVLEARRQKAKIGSKTIPAKRKRVPSVSASLAKLSQLEAQLGRIENGKITPEDMRNWKDFPWMKAEYLRAGGFQPEIAEKIKAQLLVEFDYHKANIESQQGNVKLPASTKPVSNISSGLPVLKTRGDGKAELRKKVNAAMKEFISINGRAPNSEELRNFIRGK